MKFLNNIASKLGYISKKEVYQVYTGELPDIDDHHEWSSCAWCGDKNAEHINGRCQTCLKRDMAIYEAFDVSKEEINELNERLVTLDITYRNAQQERQELYDQYLGLKEENARLIEQGLEYQNQVRSLKSQLAAEEQERLAKDATLQQIRNILDRHYAM